FENGKILIPEIQILSSSSSLTLDKIELTQAGEVSADGAIFMVFSSGTVSIKNGCNIVASTSQPNLSVSEGCTVTVQDSTIESSEGEAISMSGGDVTLSGTTVKNGEECESPCVSVLDGTLSVTNGSKIISKGFDHAMFLSNGIFSVTNESQIIVEGYGNAIEFTGGTLTVSDSIIKANDMFALHLEKIEAFPAPKAIVTNSTLTSGGDVISIYGAELNLKDTTVTTTGAENYSGIRVSGSADSHAFVKMDGGVVNVPNSSEGYAVLVRTTDYTYDYDICKFVLTGGGKITGKENGLEMDCGTFVMLGGTIETARSGAAAVELANCMFAMTDSYDEMTTTLTNRVDKIECCFSEEKSICILMGGNSHANTVNVNDCTVIFAQVSDISGVEKFVGYVQNPVGTSGATFVAKTDFTIEDLDIDFNWPAGFSHTTDESPYSYFDLNESETGYFWEPSTLVYGDDDILFWKAWQL
ncbi:MAG: hypothetical protein IJP62_09470, partial [Treponema sp.]|nr:hypothetical protein [Treponema sp.]